MKKLACSFALAASLAASLFLSSCSAQGAGTEQTAASSGGQSAASESQGSQTVVSDDFHLTDIGADLVFSRSMDLQYAKRFTVDYYEGGYKLICVADGARYLVIPEGAPVPEGLSSDIVTIQQPLSNIYLAASDSMCLFDALDALDTIRISGIKQEDWSIAAAREAMQDGRILYGGKYSSPDYDLLLQQGTSLALESTMINHTPDVREKLLDLHIPVLVEMASYEDEPLGRTEWVKLYGALLNKEDAADALFNEQVETATSFQSEPTGKTVAFFYINSNGAAVVRRPGDYVSKMIEDAGGTYIFNGMDFGQTARSTITLEMETFYEQAHDADYIIYNTSIDDVETIQNLLQKNQLLADFKAVKDGNVFCTSRDMYQQMTDTGAIIKDIHTILTDPSADELEYIKRMH
ncbi:MAG: ABC transporter substrate-binding protein [Atopobiaceae bacterium]|jgi:iron complex transport system substrate-binding protein